MYTWFLISGVFGIITGRESCGKKEDILDFLLSSTFNIYMLFKSSFFSWLHFARSQAMGGLGTYLSTRFQLNYVYC